MLCISRREGESFKIGNHITVIIRKTRRNGVRVAIDAPAEVSIRRSELQPKPERKGAA